MKTIILLLLSVTTYAQNYNPALNIWNNITADTLIVDNDSFVFNNSVINVNHVKFVSGGNYSLSLVGASKLNVCTIEFTEDNQRIFFSNGNGAEVNFLCDDPNANTLSKIINTSTLSLEEYIKTTYTYNGSTINFNSRTKGTVYDLNGRQLLKFDSFLVDLRHLKGVLIIKLDNYAFKILKL